MRSKVYELLDSIRKNEGEDTLLVVDMLVTTFVASFHARQHCEELAQQVVALGAGAAAKVAKRLGVDVEKVLKYSEQAKEIMVEESREEQSEGAELSDILRTLKGPVDPSKLN